MNYSIIGTGNMAWWLAAKLHDAGHICIGIYGRNKVKAKALAEYAGGKVYSSFKEISDDGDVCIIAVSDSSVAEIAAKLRFQNTTLLHTAGAVSQDVLSNSANHYGVLWLMYSMVKGRFPEHRNIPTIWESSSKEAEKLIFKIADTFTDNIFFADTEQRKWLHLTAVIGNNFINHLMYICHKICEQQNLPFSIAQPIIQQTFQRIVNTQPELLQTGPAVRGDKTTMQVHKEMLSANPYWKQLYDAISNSIENSYARKDGKKDDMN